MAYAFVKMDYQTRLRGRQVVVYLGLLVVYIAALYAILLGMQPEGQHLQVHDARVGRRLFTVIVLVETAIVVCLSPLFTVNTFSAERQQHALADISLSPVRSTTIVLGKLALPVVLMSAVIVASVMPALSLKFTLGGVTAMDMLVTRGLLLVFALGFLVLGFFCSTLFHDVYTATGVAYLVGLCLVGGVILAGPLIDRLPHAGGLMQSVLLVNPFIGISSAIGFDIMRTELIYALSPIGQRQFVYPSWYAVFVCYLLSSLMLSWGAVWRVESLRRNCDRWGVPS